MRYTREDGCRVWLTTAMLRPDALRALMADSGSAEQVYDRFCAEGDAFLHAFALGAAGVAAGEIAVIFVLGTVLYFVIEKNEKLKTLLR